MDAGRELQLDPRLHPYLDHGYAVTSHSSQGQTADRVLIHVDPSMGAKDLLNNRMAYVAVPRGVDDPQLFTNDREKLGASLGHDVSHQSAHMPEAKHDQFRRSGRSDRNKGRAWELACSLRSLPFVGQVSRKMATFRVFQAKRGGISLQ
jgi:hypothetical protein